MARLQLRRARDRLGLRGFTFSSVHHNAEIVPGTELALIGDQYNTRKNTRQTQAGLRYERQLSAQDDLSVMMYAGERETTQFQSTGTEWFHVLQRTS